jgi:hypothetical protein
MRELADIHYPDADRIRVMMDNLSTHTSGALYEAFPAPEAHREELDFFKCSSCWIPTPSSGWLSRMPGGCAASATIPRGILDLMPLSLLFRHIPQ